MDKIFLIILIAFLGIMLLVTGYNLDEKTERIRELEREVWDLKLKKHTDSLIQHHATVFKNLDSMLESH